MQPFGGQRHRQRFEVVSNSGGTSCRATVGVSRADREEIVRRDAPPMMKGELNTISGG
jgi:hypothetical protein